MKTLGARIRQRREELGYSQSYLASLLDYSDRSTIAKIEKGVNDIVQSKIVAFAQALETTPSYLMGWTDDPYDYGKDPEARIDSIPDSQRRAWLELGLTNDEMWRRYTAMHEEAQCESFKLQDADIRAAFFNGADPTLTEEEQAAMWDDVKRYINFKIFETQQKRKGNK